MFLVFVTEHSYPQAHLDFTLKANLRGFAYSVVRHDDRLTESWKTLVLQSDGVVCSLPSDLNSDFITFANENKIPVYQWPDCPDTPALEQRFPVQFHAFQRLCAKLFQLHKAKNADYSANNITATGELGIATNIISKAMRVANLIGFRFHIDPSTVSYTSPQTPKNEPKTDSYMDMVVYSLMAILWNNGEWAK